MTETDGTRWRGYSHKDLYLMLHDGPGAAASAEPSRRWGEVAATLTEVGQDLQKAITLTGGAWAGRAAGAAYDRLSTTVAWATEAGASAATMRTSVEDQADHIAKARADMPAPEDVPAAQPDPAVAPAVQVVQAQTDAEAAEAAASAAAERAVEVMTAYETNTNVTTAALATFDAPEPLLPSSGMHRNHGGGLLGLVATLPAGLLGGGSRRDDERRDHRGGGQRGGNHQPPTTGASSPWEQTRQPTGPAPARVTGVSTDPLLGLGGAARQAQDQERSNRGGAPNSTGNAPAPGVKSGSSALPPAELQHAQQAQHAAAASQAAASAHPGAPIAPATGAVGGQDKMSMRRFGMEAIGSSQWFGDVDEPVPGQAPKRRFDLRESTEVTESVSILDEEHKLPPNVIGEGGR